MDTTDKKEKSLLPFALQKTNDVAISTPQAEENKAPNKKEEKKSRRISGSHHVYHEKQGEKEKHDKKYYKIKYEEEHKFTLELADVVKKLNATNEALRSEVETLKSQANAVTKSAIPEIKPQTPSEPEPVSFSKVDEKSTKDSVIENLTDNPTTNTPKPTSEPGTSYWDSLSNGLGTLYSYVPSFSGIASKLPSMPQLFEPIENHHDSVTKPKI